MTDAPGTALLPPGASRPRFLRGWAPWAGLVAGLVTALQAAAAQKLNLFIWSEYIDPAVVKTFEQRFDCQVVIDLYEDNEAMLSKLQGGGSALYDVVVPSNHVIPALRKLSLLAPLRHENIPNLKHLESRFVDPPYDPGNRYAVAYQWGTLGILIRRDARVVEPTWGLFFDPQRQPGPFVLLDSPRDVVGAALQYRGFSMNSTNVAELTGVRGLLLDARRRCLGFDGTVGAKNKVLARSAVAAMVYSGEAARAIAEDPGLVYLVPQEGGQIWVDNVAILARAPHRDLAEKFVNFLLEPQVAARISNFTRFSCPNRAAREFLSPADLQNPVLYPPAEILGRMEFLQDLGRYNRLYDELWTQIKAR